MKVLELCSGNGLISHPWEAPVAFSFGCGSTGYPHSTYQEYASLLAILPRYPETDGAYSETTEHFDIHPTFTRSMREIVGPIAH
jgi:hypothetical protein